MHWVYTYGIKVNLIILVAFPMELQHIHDEIEQVGEWLIQVAFSLCRIPQSYEQFENSWIL